MLKFLACLAHSRRVDQRHHLLDVVHHNAIEQGFVTVLQGNQVEIALEVGRLRTDIAEYTQFLLRR